MFFKSVPSKNWGGGGPIWNFHLVKAEKRHNNVILRQGSYRHSGYNIFQLSFVDTDIRITLNMV